MPIDNVTWANCRKCGHRYADYMDRCPRCNSKTKHVRAPREPRRFRFTTRIIFLICLGVIITSVLVIFSAGRNIDLMVYAVIALAVSGAIAALIIDRKVTKGLQRWWDRG